MAAPTTVLTESKERAAVEAGATIFEFKAVPVERWTAENVPFALDRTSRRTGRAAAIQDVCSAELAKSLRECRDMKAITAWKKKYEKLALAANVEIVSADEGAYVVRARVPIAAGAPLLAAHGVNHCLTVASLDDAVPIACRFALVLAQIKWKLTPWIAIVHGLDAYPISSATELTIVPLDKKAGGKYFDGEAATPAVDELIIRWFAALGAEPMRGENDCDTMIWGFMSVSAQR